METAVADAERILGGKVKKEEKTAAPAVQQTRELSTEIRGVGSEIQAFQIRLPRALLMQSKTSIVEENPGKILPGEIRSSLDQELLGGASKPFEVVIFGQKAESRVYEKIGEQKARLDRIEPMTASAAMKPKTFEERGKQYKRQWRDIYFAVGVGEGYFGLPFQIDMYGMSFGTAQNINTKFFMMAQQDPPKDSLDIVVGLTTKLTELDGNKHQAFVYQILRGTSDKERAAAVKYARAFAAGQVQEADEEDEPHI